MTEKQGLALAALTVGGIYYLMRYRHAGYGVFAPVLNAVAPSLDPGVRDVASYISTHPAFLTEATRQIEQYKAAVGNRVQQLGTPFFADQNGAGIPVVPGGRSQEEQPRARRRPRRVESWARGVPQTSMPIV